MQRASMPVALAAALVLAAPARADTSIFAQPGRLGVGLGGSSVASGLTAKVHVDEALALQGVAGYYAGLGLDLAADVVLEMPSIHQDEHINVNWNLGLGGHLGVWGPVPGLGVGAFAGINAQAKAYPVELTAQLGPAYWFGDQWWSGPQYFVGGASLRWFF